MSDYTFFVCSTINSTYGSLDLNRRFSDTIRSLQSINKYAPGSRILFVDNSNEPIDKEMKMWVDTRVTEFVQLPHNLFSTVANIQKLKSASEANLMHYAFDILRDRYADSKRIFKISGRYAISEGFDPHRYDEPMYDDKYTFVVNQYESTFDDWKTRRRVVRLETGLISFTPSLIDDSQSYMGSVLWHCLSCLDTCIEESLFEHIPHHKIIPIERAYVEGNKAETNEMVMY